MSFLNATLIFGVLAAAAPVVLHLLSRREPKKVVFPSLRFLTQKFETNRSRLRIRRWWLLALRVAAIAAVAFAFARPVIHQSLSLTWVTIGMLAAGGIAVLLLAGIAASRSQSAALRYSLVGVAVIALLSALVWGATTYASGPRPTTDIASPIAIAIVIDNSPTSQWKTAEDDRITRIHNLADWIVSRVPRTSRIAVLDRSATPASFALDAASAISQIEQVHPLAVVQPIESRIEAAVRLVRSSELTSRAVIVVSDLSENTWNETLEGTALDELLAADPAVNVTLFDLGAFRGTNRRLSAMSLSDSTPPASAPVAVSTMVEFDGESKPDGQSVTAELRIYKPDTALPLVRDGDIKLPLLDVVDRVSVRIRGNGSSEMLMNVPPLSVGTHHGQIRLVGDDPLTLDDIRYFTLEVLHQSPILVVADNEDEARVIGQTITTPFLIDDPNAEYRVEMIGYRDFDAVRLMDFQAVLLLDPHNDFVSQERLISYVRSGGGLLVALGPAFETQGEPSKLLPRPRRRWRVPDPGTFLQFTQSMHPVLSPLAELPGGVPWTDFRIHQYWQFESDSSFRELARFAGREHAALLERIASGDEATGGTAGRLLLLTTPLPALADQTRSWNDFFGGSEAWPAFLLVRQIADYLTNRSSDSGIANVGNPHTVALPESGLPESQSTVESNTATNDKEEASDRLANRIQLFAPDQSTAVPIDIDSVSRDVTVMRVNAPGTYWLRGKGFSTGFSANIAPSATRLERVDAERFATLMSSARFHMAVTKDEIDLSADQEGQRVPLHSPVMLLALVVFLLEQLLSNRFYRRRNTDGHSVVGAGA
ncbi:hypothetical protein CA13_40630 [Planctomycetes bacterium CA13]|uniref:Aerotolerance regulator N-terminal domain-containing protein n=1 Tax=Novipirellula herctigrandis TaxID=2527986 RepID=A0A5C5Z5Z4_9BACT|nr:hypothetical protein CA13_40630 [Planctomycetes bacterium CA13]